MTTIPHVSIPTPGFFQMKLARGAAWSPVRIWQGFGADPLTGDVLERGWIWRAELNGIEVPIDRVWPWCAGEPIGKGDYDYLLALHRHAIKYEPAMPEASPYQAVDWSTLTFDFGKAPT